MLDFVDEPLNQIAVPVDVPVIWDGLRSSTARWDHGLRTGFRDSSAEAIGVKAHIGEQVLERKTADQVFGLEDVMHLAWGQDESNGVAERIHTDVDLRAQAAARTPDRLIFAPPFFAPAAC
jgi:hypothetical protein